VRRVPSALTKIIQIYQQTETMKLIQVIALGLLALCLGACASKPSNTTSVPASGPTTYVPAK
jgi:hypothetical protein